MKKVSVIIPHYNSKDSLVVMLNSIPNENWIETIVIDDNSDFEISILEKDYKFVKFLKVSKSKKGAGAARNLGLSNATGDYVLFADADDYFTKDAFESVKKQLLSDYEVIYFKPTSIYPNTGAIANRHIPTCLLIDDFIKYKKKEIFLKFYEPVSKLISLSLIHEKNIKFEEVTASNDVLFSLQVAYYSEAISICTDVIYVITDTENSLTKQTSEFILDCRFDSMVRYNEFLKSKGLYQYQGAMFMHLWNVKRFGINKVLNRYLYCKRNKYPVFYNLKHMLRIFKNVLAKN
ncbi:glycosyltransferase family 2 protein [Aurantibacter crassamenti]|uniref:glycosyltransferase family 2 protein n=1 Tax=Aurantibacter crassamenti TaxID=1837375 RepID=UPI00193A1C40|nr:glycosyltransferase family 2 protein [Aurantibacter crassamenti]MBM1106772.1 glycosyltransferase family 2 protein [Aurantibacter crassamenti]